MHSLVDNDKATSCACIGCEDFAWNMLTLGLKIEFLNLQDVHKKRGDLGSISNIKTSNLGEGWMMVMDLINFTNREFFTFAGIYQFGGFAQMFSPLIF